MSRQRAAGREGGAGGRWGGACPRPLAPPPPWAGEKKGEKSQWKRSSVCPGGVLFVPALPFPLPELRACRRGSPRWMNSPVAGEQSVARRENGNFSPCVPSPRGDAALCRLLCPAALCGAAANTRGSRPGTVGHGAAPYVCSWRWFIQIISLSFPPSCKGRWAVDAGVRFIGKICNTSGLLRERWPLGKKVNEPLKFARVYPPTVLFSFCKPCVPPCSLVGICLLWQTAAPDLTKSCWIVRRWWERVNFCSFSVPSMRLCRKQHFGQRLGQPPWAPSLLCWLALALERMQSRGIGGKATRYLISISFNFKKQL